MEHLTSRKNPLVRHLRSLGSDPAYRREQGEYVLDGIKLLKEAVEFGAEIKTVLWADAPKLTVEGAKEYTAPKDLVEYASPLKNAPGPVFTVAIPEKGMPKAVKRVIVLENVQDPGNVGTVIRTATHWVWMRSFSPGTVRMHSGPRQPERLWAPCSVRRF